MTAIVKIIAILICTALALWALNAVAIVAPFGLIITLLVVVLAIMGILFVAGVLPARS